MYHISYFTDFALWPILLSSAIFSWVWGNHTKPLVNKAEDQVTSFPRLSYIIYVCMYNILSYIVYIFHLNCLPRCEYFHCVLPHSRSLISDCTSPQHKRTRKHWKNLNSWVERLCLGPFLRIKIKWKHEESSWPFFMSWGHTLVHRYSKEREEKCNYTTPTAHWNHKFIQEATKISSPFLFRP